MAKRVLPVFARSEVPRAASVLVGALDDRATGRLEGQVVADHCGGGVGVDTQRLLVHRVHHEEVAVRLVALRGRLP